ncbi:hypothetical protein F2P79_025744 [Pimephales promelas]|nr:hypothetical protein F2P79_025744 [Pimephales promelas]
MSQVFSGLPVASRKDWMTTEKEGTTLATTEQNEQYPQSLPRGGEDERLNRTDILITARTGTKTTRKLKQTTLTGEEYVTKCHCGKVCKGTRGLKIHQSRSSCGRSVTQVQRADTVSGETKESSSQVAPHSAEDLYALEPPQSQRTDRAGSPSVIPIHSSRRERIKWPTSSDSKAWTQFDDDLNGILEATLAGPVHRKIESLTAVTYNLAKERFGPIEQRSQPQSPRQPNRREREIHSLRSEIKTLNKQFKIGPPAEREGIKDLTSKLRDQMWKKKAKRRMQFLKDPFSFTRTLLGQRKSGTLSSSKSEVEEFLREAHSDPFRGGGLGQNNSIRKPEEPSVELNTKEPTWQEMQDIIRKAKASAAPGPSGIPYKVYKHCPQLLKRLWRILRKIWAKGSVPPSWKLAEGCFVPKEEGSSSIAQFRTISLLSVECKIFFSVLAKRLTSYMTQNQYINTSIQKGGVPGFSGCLEHTSMITQLIQEAKQKKSDLTVIWLDLANAYGSVPHDLIQEGLDHYHIPMAIRDMISSYLGGIKLRFTAGQFTTNWQDLQKGIPTGCTISPILFVMGMNLLVGAAEGVTRGPTLESGISQPVLRAFMDDITITTGTHVQARWVLETLGAVATWARMSFKANKSRSLVIRKGKPTGRFSLHVQGEAIPSIEDNPVKCLGKWFDRAITFIKEGERPVLTKPSKPNLLQNARSWEMRVDVGKRLQFPGVVLTALRPDIVLWSTEGKKIILVELTVPWEEGCEVAHERKALKYQSLLQDCKDKGWQAWLFPVEVGCRGFPAKSTWRLLSALGMDERRKKQAVRRMGEEAERASCWIWNRREEESWKPGADGQ